MHSTTKSNGGYVFIGNQSVFNFGVDAPYTIAAWVKTSADDSDMFAVAKHKSTVQAGYLLGVNQNGGYGSQDKAWFYNRTNPDSPISTTSVTTDGKWHQIVGVRTANLVSIYVDGKLEDSHTDQNLDGISVALLIGAYYASDGTTIVPSYIGDIDDVQIYNEALTASQIGYLFNNPGSAVPIPPTAWLLGAGLVGIIGLRRRFRN